MGGEITIESRLGGGTKVSFTLPLAIELAASCIDPDLAGNRVLVLERSEQTRSIIARYLSRAGAVVDQATDGMEALALLRDAASAGRNYAIAVVEWSASLEKNGPAALQWMLGEGGHPRLGMIVLAGKESESNACRKLEGPRVKLLHKPARKGELLGAVSALLGTDAGDTASSIAAPVAVEVVPHLGLRVLVAEDNPVNQMVAEEFLANIGCTATIAVNGRDALAEWERGSFDVVLMDCMMPVLDGLSATRQLRDLEKARGCSPIPIIAVTANAYDSDRQASIDAGMNDHLNKPYSEGQLAEILRRWMHRPDAAAARAAASAAAVVAPVPAPAEKSEAPPEQSSGKLDLRVLVVEDNPVNQLVASEFLSNFGCTVTTADNGQEAVVITAKETFDVVLMDFQMPVMDGLTATRIIRQRETENRLPRIPVIAVTANAFADDRRAAVAVGMNDFLAKPYSEEDLRAVLERSASKRAPALPQAHAAAAPPPAAPASTAAATVAERSVIALPIASAPVRTAENPPTTAAAVQPVVKRKGMQERLARVYLTHAPRSMEQLVAAAEAGDVAGMKFAAHSLKSSSANVGANELSALCKELEAVSKAGDLDRGRVLLPPVVTRFRIDVAQIRAELDDPPEVNVA